MLRNRKRFYYLNGDNKAEQGFLNDLGPLDPRVAVKVKIANSLVPKKKKKGWVNF